MRTELSIAGCALALAVGHFTAQAQTIPPAPPLALSATERAIQELKRPVSWFSWGADLRARNEYFNNALTLSDEVPLHEQDYFRYRARLWTTFQPVTNLTLNARLTGEAREWMNSSYARQMGVGETGMEWRYGIIDNLYVKWTNLANLPLTLSVGRQDILIGENQNWWLVMDGTPAEGSWNIYFDSARLVFDAEEIQTKFDLVYLRQSALADEWLPTIGQSTDHSVNGAPAPYIVTEQDEQGVILYASNKSLKNTQIDAFFIYKHDERVHTSLISNGDNADIYTFGARVAGTPAEHWQYSVEGAYQLGQKQDPMVIGSAGRWMDIDAYAANARLTYLFKDRLKNQAGLQFECLSGDDAKSDGRDEMFDVLWGRWPRWSELYIYSYVNETGRKIAQLNNVIRAGANWSITPVKNGTFSATYNALFAPQNTPTRAVNGALFSDSGTFRGHLLQTVLKYQFNQHVSGHLWGEFLWQGDYYAQRDLMSFLRAELTTTF